MIYDYDNDSNNTDLIIVRDDELSLIDDFDMISDKGGNKRLAHSKSLDQMTSQHQEAA